MKNLAPRARMMVAATVAALAVLSLGAAGAQAKLVKVTGSTTVAPSEAASTFLADNGVAVAPVGPATFGEAGFTFPVFAGFGDTKTYYGLLAHSGGLRFTKGDKSAVVRRFVAVRVPGVSILLGQIPGLPGGCGHIAKALRRYAKSHPGVLRKVRRAAQQYPKAARHVVQATKRYCKEGRVIVVAQLSNLSKSVENGSATLSADLTLSRPAAKLLSRLAGAEVPAGAPLGSAVSTVTPTG
ncbi:MAG: hypothetical protein H0U84_10015 [Thermoleophilaceae bacterium]|nr:hypothetical protein [Thermoleophilaceae bacterium]